MKCPKCNELVYAEEVVDTEYYDNEHHDLCYGTCPKCNTTWDWIEVFKFAYEIDVQEMKDDK